VRGVERLEIGQVAVTYDAALEPLEPFYSLFCTGPDCPYYGDGLRRTEERRVVVE
jgi:hypothetical protein